MSFVEVQRAMDATQLQGELINQYCKVLGNLANKFDGRSMDTDTVLPVLRGFTGHFSVAGELPIFPSFAD